MVLTNLFQIADEKLTNIRIQPDSDEGSKLRLYCVIFGSKIPKPEADNYELLVGYKEKVDKAMDDFLVSYQIKNKNRKSSSEED